MPKTWTKKITDLLYGAKAARRKFEDQHPYESVIAADASKGIQTNKEEDVSYNQKWIASQRAVILLTDQNIVCGNWKIPLERIEEAKLIKLKTLFGGAQVLKVRTQDNEFFQFGMQENAEWTEQNVLPLIVEKGKIKYSAFSIIVRIVLVIYLLYWLINNFF